MVRLQDLLETEGEAQARPRGPTHSFVLTLQGGARHVFRAESKADLQRCARRSACPSSRAALLHARRPVAGVRADHRNYTKWRRTMSSLRPDADAPLQSELLVGSGASGGGTARLTQGRMRFNRSAGSAALLGLGETAVAYGDIEKIVPAEFGFDLVTPSGTHVPRHRQGKLLPLDRRPAAQAPAARLFLGLGHGLAEGPRASCEVKTSVAASERRGYQYAT